MPTDPGLVGPYSAVDNGTDIVGHPVNGYGRCEQLNTTGVCPNKAQATTYYSNQTVASNTGVAEGLGITLPLGTLTNAIIVPLIIGVLFP